MCALSLPAQVLDPRKEEWTHRRRWEAAVTDEISCGKHSLVTSDCGLPSLGPVLDGADQLLGHKMLHHQGSPVEGSAMPCLLTSGFTHLLSSESPVSELTEPYPLKSIMNSLCSGSWCWISAIFQLPTLRMTDIKVLDRRTSVSANLSIRSG